jgi:hypothetical protein
VKARHYAVAPLLCMFSPSACHVQSQVPTCDNTTTPQPHLIHLARIYAHHRKIYDLATIDTPHTGHPTATTTSDPHSDDKTTTTSTCGYAKV